MHDGLKWAGTGVLLAAFGVAAFFAHRRGVANEAKLSAEEQAKTLVVALAKCIVDKSKNGGLPPSSTPLPMQIEDLRTSHQTWKEWAQGKGTPYDCAAATTQSALKAQVVWIRDLREGKDSRVLARIDPDGDGRPDGYFEAPVFCLDGKGRANCVESGYAFTVLEDGVRRPPPLAKVSKGVRDYQGAPPSLDDAMDPSREETVPALPGGGSILPKAATANRPLLGAQLTGQAAFHGLVLEGARALVAKAEPTFTLVGLEASSLEGENIDPARKQILELHFGQVDSSERLTKGSNLLVVTYTEQGLVSERRSAKSDLMALALPNCSAPEAFKTAPSSSASLVRSPGHGRVLWVMLGKKKGQKVNLDAETCTIVRR